MSLADVLIKDVGGHNTVPTATWNTEAGTTVINPGEPTKIGSGRNYAIVLADAEPVIGTTSDVIGIAQSTSTQTASADGVVEVYLPLPGVIYEVKAKTASNVDTQAKIDALVGKRVLFDLTSSVFTVDTSTADGATNGVAIVGGNVDNASVFVQLRTSGTYIN